jgi:hypothetical protein
MPANPTPRFSRPRLSRRHLCLAAAAAALLATPALAHHGWSSYDSSKVMTIEGPILAAETGFPHAHIEIEHDDRRWDIVLAPPSRMTARGLPGGALAEGVVVRVEGYPSTRTEWELRAEAITIDGKTIQLR